jgi:hypothetical protein
MGGPLLFWTAMKQPQVIDGRVSFDEDHTDPDGTKLVIKRSQNIPDEHISALKRDKIDTDHDRIGDFVRVASIPVEIVAKWEREGFKLEEHNIHQILNRLKAEHLDAFITTRKSI